MQTINIQFRDFFGNHCMQVAEVRKDSFGEGQFIVGPLGWGKTRKDLAIAVQEYLGGRELIQIELVTNK